MIARSAKFVNNFLAITLIFLILVIEQTMTVSLKLRVRDLLPELLADALVFLCTLKSAGTISSGALQAFLYRSNDLLKA